MLGLGQKHYDFNPVCQQAYRSIVELRLEEGRRLLETEKKRDPGNLIPYFLDNYIDFFQLFFNEDAAQYAAWKDRRDQRLELMSEGPETSPLNLFTRSVIRFQWAAIQIKFGDNWDAAWDFRRSFLQSKDCSKQFPSFLPASMLSGAMEVVAGTIPDGYKWLSNLLGIRGSITGGMQRLERFLTAGDATAELFRNEAIFYYLYLQFYIGNKRSEVFDYIGQHQLDVRNNHLFTYLYANLCINDQRSALAQQIIRQMNPSPEYLDMPVWDLEMGYACLNHLEPEAAEHFQRFLQRFKGKFYVKDVWQKMSWYYYLKGDGSRADSCRRQVLVKGTAASDADRQALKEARSGKWPNKSLLQARLLDDGGYFEEALRVLQAMGLAETRDEAERCEYTYRLGRIYDGLGRGDEAITAYQATIRTGENLREYYAARAALQAGYIYERRGDRVKAIGLYEKCLSMQDHDYKNSLDQRAKAGIARCKGN
ncbi:MAG TPA: tetratricopeptide repeat protein [Puia sp.]|nr:tetratricopeptide repeat protein [Puia sp.]